jgi:hypothetical protein
MNREPSLDALRGLAIIGMVLSGSIAFGGVLPAWMYHAQVPPPLHQFDPTLAGITWVDLVFPFFLFSMGAAFPLALRAAIEQQRSSMHFFGLAAKRFFMLAFFALFTQHLKAWVIAPAPGTKEQWYSLLAFLLLFGIFLNVPQKKYASYAVWIKAGSFAVAVLLLTQLPFHNGTGFNLYKSDIILMVLANMAFFGSFIYAHTANRPLLRLLVLPAVAAIIVSSRENASSWVKDFFYFNELAGYKFDWLYSDSRYVGRRMDDAAFVETNRIAPAWHPTALCRGCWFIANWVVVSAFVPSSSGCLARRGCMGALRYLWRHTVESSARALRGSCLSANGTGRSFSLTDGIVVRALRRRN